MSAAAVCREKASGRFATRFGFFPVLARNLVKSRMLLDLNRELTLVYPDLCSILF
jgi:hypothetical protein